MAKELLTIPKGVASYPWLNKADDKFGPAKYKCDLLVPIDTTTDLTAKLEDLLTEFYEGVVEREGDSGKYSDILKADMPYFEEDGQIVFRSSVNQFGENNKGDKWENKVGFYDAKGRFIPEDKRPRVGGGSILKLSIEPRLWAIPATEGRGKAKKTILNVGIKLVLKGVQVLEAKQGGNAPSAEKMGFGEEEGFEYDPDAFDTDSAADGSTDDGDF